MLKPVPQEVLNYGLAGNSSAMKQLHDAEFNSSSVTNSDDILK